MKQSILQLLTVFLLTLLSASGCGTSPVTRYYMLVPMDAAAPAGTAGMDKDRLHLIVGPVRLPEYLQRSPIVRRRDEAELFLDDSHRWAEDLGDNITRVLAENLYHLSGGARVDVYPLNGQKSPGFRVAIEILRFDANDSGVVRLIANWRIHEASTDDVVLADRSDYRLETRPDAGYAEIVAGLSKAVDRLSQDIHNTLAGIRPGT